MMDTERKTDTEAGNDLRKRQRGKNYAMLAVLLALVALIYVVAMVRMSGGAFP